MYTVSEAAGTLRPSITILSSSLPEGTKITFNVSTAPDSATGQSIVNEQIIGLSIDFQQVNTGSNTQGVLNGHGHAVYL